MELSIYLWALLAICVILIVTGVVLVCLRGKGTKHGRIPSSVTGFEGVENGRNRQSSATMDPFPHQERGVPLESLMVEDGCGDDGAGGDAQPVKPDAAVFLEESGKGVWANQARLSERGESLGEKERTGPISARFGTQVDKTLSSEDGLENVPDIPGKGIGETVGSVAPVSHLSGGSHKASVDRNSGSLPALEPSEQLLLLKSHELLLTLSDGLKKLSLAKTDAVRKEKIAEMQAAIALLDVKSEWNDYKACFEKVYPGFWPKVESLSNEEMSPYELRLCALLSLGMGTKDIADLTNRSVRTVETSIYKIRKKLNMDSDVKTQDFLKGLL